MSSATIENNLGLGGRYFCLPRGSLAFADERELLVSRSAPGAFELSRQVATDTLRSTAWGWAALDAKPTQFDADVVRNHDDAVVWGGPIAAPEHVRPHSSFAHFLLESVARLWPLLPGGELEGLPVVFTLPQALPYVEEWLAAFGASTVDLPDQGAVRFKRVFVPEPAWQTGSWIAPELRDIHLHARRGMAVTPAPQRDVLWLSRSELPPRSVPHGESRLESLLGDRISVIRPGTTTLAELVGRLESSRAVAGVIGSAFHTLLLTTEPPNSLYLCPPWDKGVHAAQQKILGQGCAFIQALEVADLSRDARNKGINFPGDYRLSISRTLGALEATILPGLLREPDIARSTEAGAVTRPVKRPGLGGEAATLSRGSLDISEQRDLFVQRSAGAPFTRQGELVIDTPGPRKNLSRVRLDNGAVRFDQEDVVWGGVIAGHYGHFLIETVTRLWPLLPNGVLEDLPVVFAKPKTLPFVSEWLAAFGARTVDLPDQGAVRFKRMLIPEPAWQTGSWIAPELRDIHLHARRGMAVTPAPQKRDVLWLSRSELPQERLVHDEALLEWLLGKHVSPLSLETMTLAEQAAALEGSRAAAGVIGSAFHTLLLTIDQPDCLYLCPPWAKGAYPAQHRFLNSRATFSRALDVLDLKQRKRVPFPSGFRLLIPEALHALRDTLIPDLFDDTRIAAFAALLHRNSAARAPAFDHLDSAAAQVILDPLSLEARRRLGELFADAGLDRCAKEQLAVIAHLVTKE